MSAIKGLKPVAVMILVQVVLAGLNIVYKLALNDGMDAKILVAYRYVFAAAVLCPLALFLERHACMRIWFIFLSFIICLYYNRNYEL